MKTYLPFSLTCLLTCLTAGATEVPLRPAADLIVHHAKIWTVDPSHPQASGIAILGERIVAVGSDKEVMAWKGPRTQVVDAKGQRLLPGFNDAHVHFSGGGAALAAVQLNDVTSATEFVRRVAEKAKELAPGQWMRQGEWDETKWSPAEFPTRQMIDAVTPDNPVSLERYDGHMVLANTQALKLAGITAATADPPGGVIVRDNRGEPTGALKDAAMGLLERIIPAPRPSERRQIAERALHEAASLGVTSVQDMADDYEDISVYAQLRDEGLLTTRLYAAPPIARVEDQAHIGLRHAFGDSLLRVGAVKGFADGSLGSRTAYFFEGFTDDPSGHGLLSEDLQPISRMQGFMERADSAGLQICTHAIGDRGISTILDLYQSLLTTHGPADRRWRIEHAQHMAEKDFDRFRELGVIASVQPYHAIDDGRWAESRIGHDRASRTYAFRTFLNHGVRLAFGTDWPVAPLNPMLGLYAATTRATLDGRNPNGWFPEQKLTIQEAIELYTMGSAYAEFQEQVKGSITVGKLADFILLSEDLLSLPAQEIPKVKVLKTWVGGRLVYDRDRAPKTTKP